MARCLPHPVRHAFGMRALSKQQLVIGSMALPFGYNCQCQQLQLSSSHLSDSCSFFQVSDCVSRRAPQNVGQEPGRAFLGSGFGLANPFHHRCCIRVFRAAFCDWPGAFLVDGAMLRSRYAAAPCCANEFHVLLRNRNPKRSDTASQQEPKMPLQTARPRLHSRRRFAHPGTAESAGKGEARAARAW